jgi:methionine synthase II (cobalamin-independent)
MKISKDTSIEELVGILPEAVKYLMVEGIKCIACGEPIWGTLEEAAIEKGFKNDAIERFVTDLNELLVNKKDKGNETGQSIKIEKLDI